MVHTVVAWIVQNVPIAGGRWMWRYATGCYCKCDLNVKGTLKKYLKI